MTEQQAANEGTAQYKRDQRRRASMIAASIVIILVAGGAMVLAGKIERSGGGLGQGQAILLALLFVGGFVAANWIYLRNVDELEWANNVDAFFWGLMVLVVLYPTWMILWFGGLVPEPDAEGIYMGTLLSAGAVYGWKRLRQLLS